MTRVLPRKWHVHLGFILSPQPRRALDRHTRLENHRADPDSSHSGIRTNGIVVPRGPLMLAMGVAVQSRWVPAILLQSYVLVGPGPPW